MFKKDCPYRCIANVHYTLFRDDDKKEDVVRGAKNIFDKWDKVIDCPWKESVNCYYMKHPEKFMESILGVLRRILKVL